MGGLKKAEGTEKGKKSLSWVAWPGGGQSHSRGVKTGGSQGESCASEKNKSL